MRYWIVTVFLVMWFIPGLQAKTESSEKTFYLSCQAENDLYQVLKSNHIVCARYNSPTEVVNNAPAGAAVLVLANGYPGTTTAFDSSVYTMAVEKNQRLFVEFPAQLPGLAVGAVRTTTLERGVVTSKVFEPTLTVNDIVLIHGCHFVEVQAAHPYIVMAKVAGFDRAAYGLAGTVSYPVLFEHPKNHNLLISTTKLSQFVTARYGPKSAWQAIWKMIFQWLTPSETFADLHWTMTVRPTYQKDEKLSPNAQREAIIRGIDWHNKAKLLIHDSWKDEYKQYGGANPVGPRPDPCYPIGDGRFGMLEGVHSQIECTDGGQKIRWWLRSDCNGESTFAFALRSMVDGNTRSATIARNLADWVYFNSGLLHNNDPSDGNYGLLGWAPDYPGVFYQENDIKAILGCMGTAAVLKTDRWDEVLAKNILGNFRTTGRNGFRGNVLADPAVSNYGWQHFWRRNAVNFHPHYEAWIWASYLWLYDKTGYAPLLERTRKAITLMMQTYPQGWNWTNGFQQERGRMLLPLAWLVRVDDKPQHRKWLEQIANDMMEDQDACGAIREELGELNKSHYAPPKSNSEYSTNEAPLIQQNGDPLADMLYTCNFTFLGLHEAYAATGNHKYREMEDKLAEFFLRIQVKSQHHPELDGAWFRAFDYHIWDYWGSNADAGWGAWSVEAGWTQGWIITVLSLRELNKNLWDLTKNSNIKSKFAKIRTSMLPDEQIKLSELYSIKHDGIGKSITANIIPAPQYSGKAGIISLVDGRLNDPKQLRFDSSEWLGFLGDDLEATIDLGSAVPINKLAVSCFQQVGIGIFLPVKVVFLLSDNNRDYQVDATVEPGVDIRQAGPLAHIYTSPVLNKKARYVKVRVTNVGVIPEWHKAKGHKAWLFVDEIMINLH